MKKIAVEEHVQLQILEELNAQHEARLGYPNLFDAKRFNETLGPVYYAPPEAHRIPLMDRLGLDMQILSVGGLGIQYDNDTARAIQNAHMANTVLADLVKQYPDRFRAFGVLPMQDPAAAAEELDRCKELGFVGIMQFGPTDFHYYDEPQFDGIWKKLAESHMPLYIHASSPEPDQIRMYDGYSELLGNTWNWGVFTATHALRILFSGVFDRYPEAQLILGHMGESLPYLLGRLDEGYDCRNVRAMGRMQHHPSYYMRRNLLITTSGGWNPEAMHCAIEALGAERILFANDYPHYPLETSMRQMDASNLTPEQEELIYHGNAERIFGL